jgi:RHS repeat-associated protein
MKSVEGSVCIGLLMTVMASLMPVSAQDILFIDSFEQGSTLTGRLLDTNAFVDQGLEVPIVGATVSLLNGGQVDVTNAQGEFVLPNIISGEQVLDIDSATANNAPNGDTYAGFRERIVIDAGFVSVQRPFYLPRIDASSLTIIDPTQDTVVTNPNLDISMTVFAGTAMAENGTLFEGQLSISDVPEALAPAALPDFLEPGMLITIQPVGVTFTTPAPITFPNFDNLPPGSGTDLWSLDPESGQFVVVGTGEVSADGQRIETVTGGIVAADWHAPPPPPPAESDGDGDGPPSCLGCCPGCGGEVGSEVDLFNGQLTEQLALPGVISMGQVNAPEFVYRSKRAYPMAVVPVNTGIVSRAAIPEMVSYRGFVDGELVQDEIFVDTSSLVDGNDEPFRVAVPFDNSARPSGIYETDVFVTSIYERSRISRPNPRPLSVVNGQDSPFGAGWSLTGLDRLIPDAAGTIREQLLLEQGNGGSIQYDEQLTGVNPDGIITILSHNDPTQPFQAGEISAIQNILNDMGHASQVVFRADFNQEVVDQSRMILFFDASFVIVASNADIQQVPDLLLAARANGMPLYFLGSEPANFRNFGNTDEGFEFIDKWLDLVHMDLASNSNGGQGLVNVLNTGHPIFDGPAGSLTQYTLDNDSDIARGSNTGETVLASTATADIVLVAESDAGGRTVVQNHTLIAGEPVVNRADIEIVFRNTIEWLLDSPSISSGFFGENTFAGVDGDHAGIIYDPDADLYTRFLRNGHEQVFGGDGLLIAQTDRNGNATTYAYDPQGRVQTMTDLAGRITTFAYDGNGKLDSVTDPAGRVTDFTVDASGDLVAVELPDQSTRSFVYDGRHLLTSQTDQRGFTTDYQFDSLGFFIQSTQADGSVRSSTAAQNIGLVDTSGGQGTMSNPAPITRPDAAVSGFIDPEGRVLTAETGRFGEPVAVSGLDGLMTIYVRDENGNPLQVTRPNGAVFDASYDSVGNQLSVTDQSANGSWSYEYDNEFNRVTKVTDPFGASFISNYDDNGNQTGIESPEGRTHGLTYDANGQFATWTDQSGLSNQITYDANGLLSQINMGTGPDQRSFTFTQTNWGAFNTITDPAGQTFTYSYDGLGRRISMELPDAQVIGLEWDDGNNLISLTPPGQLEHRMTYTSFDLIAGYQPPAVGGVVDTSYSYNMAQQLTLVSRPDGRSIAYSYDDSGRLETKAIDRGTINYNYSSITGELIGLTAPGGETLSFSYLGDYLTSQTWSGTLNASVARTVDSSARPATETVDGANLVSWIYDDDHLLLGVGSLNITRDAATGFVSGTTLGLVSDAKIYNDFGEPVDHLVAYDGNEIYAHTLTRDNLGRVITETQTILGVTTHFNYIYDNRDRLLQVDRNGMLEAQYSYDANSNRLSRDDGTTTETGVYDAQDRLINYDGVSYAYRQSGELLTKTDGGNSTTYAYDEVGNLISVVRPDGVSVEYDIDGLDRRIGKRINGTLIQAFSYRNDLQIVAEYNGSGSLVSRFVYSSSLGAPEYMEREGNTYRVITDRTGSVRLVVDVVSGVVAQRLDYDAFGRILVDTNPGFQPFGFAGGVYDPDTGLTRFGARDYDPNIGRWTAKDPIGFEGGSTNLYLYADGDPVNVTDPGGLNPSSSGNDFSQTLVGRVIDVDGPGVWVDRLQADGTRGRFQACQDQNVFLGDRFTNDENTTITIQFYMGGRAQIRRGDTQQVITSESVASPPQRFFKVNSDLGIRRNQSDRIFEIQTAGGVIGIEG